MAWTAPRTWVAGEIVTASIVNSAIRDNFRYLKGLDGDITFEANVLTAYLVDGVDVSGHHARHESGGGDALAAPLATTTLPALTDGKIWKGDATNRPAEIAFTTSARFAYEQLLNSNDTERSTSTSNVKLKEIKLNEAFAGSVRIKFDGKGAGSPCWVRIYRNGSALGTSRNVGASSTYVTYTEDFDISWSANDLIQLYTETVGYATAVCNFRFYYGVVALGLGTISTTNQDP